eukprot:4806353-Pyramimonas_sp.AAC.1
MELDPECRGIVCGEAECEGMVTGASVAFGLQAVFKEFEIDCGISLKNEVSAAIAIASGRGLGKGETDRRLSTLIPGE